MKRKFTAIFCTLLAALSVISLFMPCYAADDNKITVIVTVNDGISPDDVIARTMKVCVADIGFKYSNILNGFSAVISEQDLPRIRNICGVKTAEYEATYAQPQTFAQTESAENDFYDSTYLNSLSYASEDYDGSGTAVAVIDSGFIVGNPYFALSDTANAKISKNDVCAVFDRLNASDPLYYSAKIPFVYDYAEMDNDVRASETHGNHVAGIIGANSVNVEDSSFMGAVPETQLILMKVFYDDGMSYAGESAIIAALEDAFILGADVINLSLGTDSGFSDGTPLSGALTEAINNITIGGCAVVCAAGNSGLAGNGSSYTKDYEIKSPSSALTETGTVASPATLESTSAVGALSEAFTVSRYFSIADGTKIAFSDTTYMYIEPLGDYFAQRLTTDIPIEYFTVPGTGSAEDFASMEDGALDGKIALVKRGINTFVEKTALAAEYGAVAVICYNNVGGGTLINMELNGAEIPAAAISLADGELMAAAHEKTITLNRFDVAKFENSDSSLPLTLSSWGVTPEMKLKPDISAIGNNVYSLGANGGESRSGTSMAAAFVSGAYVILKQYSNENDLNLTLDEMKIILANAALPIRSQRGSDYSPRVCGAGKLDIENIAGITDTPILITSSGKPKIELGDRLNGDFLMNFDIKNTTSSPISIELYASVGGDNYYYDEKAEDTAFISGAPQAWNDVIIRLNGEYNNLNKYHEKADYPTLTIPADGSINIMLRFYIPRERIAEYSKIFKNGFFIEGYIYAQTDSHTSSIPYIGFCGDWSKSPVFDQTIYSDISEAEPYYSGSYLYSHIDAHGLTPMISIIGMNNFTDNNTAVSSLNAFSPNGNGDADELYMVLYLLKSVEYAEYSITDSDRNIIFTDTSENDNGNTKMQKSYSDSTDKIKKYTMKIWNGRASDNSEYIYSDGDYFLNFTVYTCGVNSSPQTLVIPIKIDTALPKLTEYKISDSNGMKILNISAADTVGIQYLRAYGAGGYEKSFSSCDNAVKLTDDGTLTLSFDISDYTGSYIYLDITDYAFNTAAFRIELDKSETVNG